MFSRLRQLVLVGSVVAATSGAALMTAPAANAAGCSSFEEVTACISQDFGDIDSGMNLNFIGIPPGCSASISLYKVINGEGVEEITLGYRCVKGHVGDILMPINLVGHGTFYTVACAQWNTGGVCAYSSNLTV